MTSTELNTTPDAGDRDAPPSDEDTDSAERPDRRDMLSEVLALVEVVPIAGPPAILLVGPLVLFALLLAGPFTALLTIVAAAAVVALAGLVLASPYLLVRHLLRRRAAAARPRRAPAPAPHLAPATPRQVTT